MWGAKVSGAKVDWHFIGGRGIAKTTGSTFKVHEAIQKLRDEYDRLRMAALSKVVRVDEKG
jgi:hypothetical protein